LIVAGGAWASELLKDLGIPLLVRRKSLFWYQNEQTDYQAACGCPGFLYELPHGVFYGFPQWDASGVKVAEHSGGATVTDPLQVDRDLDPVEAVRVKDFLSRYLPGVSPKRMQHEVCLYTMSPDGHFIVDTHPRHTGLAFAAGLSGHGFKFTAMLGEALVQMVFDGQAAVNIDFLSRRRLNMP
jgi:glycine/D-amino acid oxidase-like deaminating enzyme